MLTTHTPSDPKLVTPTWLKTQPPTAVLSSINEWDAVATALAQHQPHQGPRKLIACPAPQLRRWARYFSNRRGRSPYRPTWMSQIIASASAHAWKQFTFGRSTISRTSFWVLRSATCSSPDIPLCGGLCQLSTYFGPVHASSLCFCTRFYIQG